jgi:uncharacterized repeat protein (TIGR03803 family)
MKRLCAFIFAASVLLIAGCHSSNTSVLVPNLVNYKVAIATAALQHAGLVLGTNTSATSATVPAGDVISQYPYAGTSVDGGSAVNIVVSSGPAVAAAGTVLHSFSGSAMEGLTPTGGLVQDAAGNLWGTTFSGGTGGRGTVFRISPSTAQTVVYSFGGPGGDAANPLAGLVVGADGNFYGVSARGGANQDRGAFFRVTPAGGEAVLHSFGGSRDDAVAPDAPLVQGLDGNFYGTSTTGGAYGAGTIYRVTPDGVETVLLSFSGSASSDPSGPSGGLVQGADGYFYGTTRAGGEHGVGTVFSLSPAGALSTLYSFGASDTDGNAPRFGVIQGSDGNFYGTTSLGGTSGSGTVFRLTYSGIATVLHSFGSSDADGTNPGSGLVQGSDGKLYGVTRTGGFNGEGTVFSLAADGAQTVLYSFGSTPTDAVSPAGPVLLSADGSIYGISHTGEIDAAVSDSQGPGTVYRISR